MPAVSVIIPTYNHARYLPQAINSVLEQTFEEVEIIVIDDGSTDDTAELAAGFGDAIRYVYQENKGLSAARNTGLNQATGNFIALLDADDLYEADFLTTMASTLGRNPYAQAAYCGFSTIDENGRRLYQSGIRTIPPDQFYGRLLRGNFIVPSCMLVKRAAYEQAGLFDTHLKSAEDWDMWLRIGRSSTVVGVPAALVRYRLHSANMSGNPERMLQSRTQVLQKHLGPEHEAAEDGREAFAQSCLESAYEFLQAGNRPKALSLLQHAVALSPSVLTGLDTYYELALWDQAKGYRGDLSRIDLARSEQLLMALLDDLFASPDLPLQAQRYRDRSYSLANQTLGLFSYGRRELPQARRYFLRALAAEPSRVAAPRLATTLVKSMLPTWLLPARATAV